MFVKIILWPTPHSPAHSPLADAGACSLCRTFLLCVALNQRGLVACSSLWLALLQGDDYAADNRNFGNSETLICIHSFDPRLSPCHVMGLCQTFARGPQKHRLVGSLNAYASHGKLDLKRHMLGSSNITISQTCSCSHIFKKWSLIGRELTRKWRLSPLSLFHKN